MRRPIPAPFRRPLPVACLAAAAALLHTPGVGAQVLIDQARVLAGGVTPGDQPGFPLTISQPGSYRLAGNLEVPPGLPGIEITAQGVTLDLNGFTVGSDLRCKQDQVYRIVSCTYPAPVAGVFGILVSAPLPTGVTLRNGVVGGFRNSGVVANEGTHLTDLVVRDNGGVGVQMNFGVTGLTVERVEAMFNRYDGVVLGSGTGRQVRAHHNGGNGIAIGGSALLESSVATLNRGLGIQGMGRSTTGSVRATVSMDNLGGDIGKVRSLGGNATTTTVY